MTTDERHAEQRSVLSELGELEAEDARLYARRMELRARMDELWTDGPQEQFGVIELAGTARIGQGRASTQLVNGTRLTTLLPGTLAALHAGVMFTQTAVLLLELTGNCAPAVVSEVERRVLSRISRANTTEARRIINRVIPEVEADLDPVLTQERLDLARSRSSVVVSELPDSMARIRADLDVVAARRWTLDFEELVRAQKLADDRAGVERTQDQRRAAVFAQLPSRFLALLLAVQGGKTDELLVLASADPELADGIEALACSLPVDLVSAADPEPPHDGQPQPDYETAPDLEPLSELDSRSDLEPLSELDSRSDLESLDLEPPPDPGEPAPEPPPDPGEPDREPHWTDLSARELAAGVMGLPVHNPVMMNVHVPMSTALELDNRTARIQGAGDLPAAHARLLVLEANLRRVFVDPDSGVPLGIDPTVHPPGDVDWLAQMTTPFVLGEHAEPRHDPSRRLQELVELRDQTCTGIGCSLPARRCHKDHEIAYPEGHTAEWNLSAKSARCHRAKHAGWTVTRHGPGPQHGTTTWTSPLGHSYTRLSAWDPPMRT